MRKAEYKKGLKVRQRSQPRHFSGQNPYPRKEGETVSDELVVFRVGKAEYALVLWDGSKKAEHVHFAAIDIVQEEVAEQKAAAPT